MVAERLPVDVPVGVVSRGDDGLRRTWHRPAWHMPHDTNGRWAGCYPADEQEALVQSHDLMADGAGLLLVPPRHVGGSIDIRRSTGSTRSLTRTSVPHRCGRRDRRRATWPGRPSVAQVVAATPTHSSIRVALSKPRYPPSFGAMLLGVLFSLAAPWPLALLVDSALGDKPPPPAIEAVFGTNPMVLVVVAVVAGLLITLLTGILRTRADEDDTNLSQRMILDFRSELFAHAQRLSQAFHDGSSHGRIHRASDLEAQNIGEITVSMPPLLSERAHARRHVLHRVRLAPGLAPALAVVPFIYLSTGYYAKKIEPRLYEVRNAEGKSLSIVHEAMSMLRVIVAFGRQDHELQRFRNAAQRTVDARVAVTVRQTMFSLVVDGITATGYASVLGFGAAKVINGSLSVGQLLVIVAYIQAVYRPLQKISGTLATLQNLFVGLEGAFDLLDANLTCMTGSARCRSAAQRGAVEFRNVGFAYQGRHDMLRGHLVQCAGRRPGRDRRPDGRRQDDVDESVHPVLRPTRGSDPARWARHDRDHVGVPAREHRRRPSRSVAVRGHDHGQHPVRAGSTRPTKRCEAAARGEHR